jgi:TPR repeat protein
VIRGVLLGLALLVIAGAVVAIVVVVKGDKTAESTAQSVHTNACSDDEPEACIDDAFALMGREAGEVDDVAAKDVLQRACKRDYDKACLMLDAFEQHKLRIAEGRCEGRWFAAVPASCLDAGTRHLGGVGTEQSATKAKTFFDKGCKLGHQPACEAKVEP